MTTTDSQMHAGSENHPLPLAGRPKFCHFILTMFNVKRADFGHDVGGRPTATNEWMAHRLDLFEWLCYPSLRAQTCRNFHWLVFFDAGTSDRFRERIHKYREFPNFESVFVDGESKAREEILRRVPPETSHLISTRLDNDDALHRKAVATIQRHFAGQDGLVLNLLKGYALSGDRLYLVEHRSNAFASLIERRGPGGFKTVWCASHTELARVAPIHDVPEGRLWLQCMHERNVLNRIAREQHGYWRWRIRLATRNFLVRLHLWPGTIIDVPNEKPAGLTLDDLRGEFAFGPPPARSPGHE